MKLPVRLSVARKPLVESGAEVLVLYRHEDGPVPRTGDRAADRRLRAELERRGFRGRPGTAISIDVPAGGRAMSVIVAGLGPKREQDALRLRRAGAAVARTARQLRRARLASAIPPAGGKREPADERMRLAAEGICLGAYRFDKYRTVDVQPADPLRVAFWPGPNERAGRAALDRAASLARGVFLARDLVNEPPAAMTPRELAARARAAGRAAGLSVRTLGPREMTRERMGALLAVSAGSDQPPRVVHLTYKPPGKPRARLAFVGKGVTFDAGGYNIKTGAHINDMKMDMAGAAAVVGALVALAEQKVPVEVHGLLGMVENLVSGGAYKPGDIVTTRRGLKVEVNNTDAEGRLVLADLLDYARSRVRAELTVDVATLTGACVIALGTATAGVMGNDDDAVERVLEAGRRAGERLWPLPLVPEDRRLLKSDVADLKNTGPRWGGALTAGLFLREFAGDTPWVHIDIAGPAFSDRDDPLTGKGGTGAAVATLVELARSR